MSLASIDQALAAFWVEVLRHLWQSALVITPLFIVARMLRTAPARWTHRLWLGALIKLFVPLALLGPPLGVLMRRLVSRSTPSEVDVAGVYRVLATIIGTNGAAPSSALDRLPNNLWVTITVGYAAIAAWLLVRLCRDVLATRHLCRQPAQLTEAQQEAREKAISAAGVSASRVVIVELPVIPRVTGMLRPVIVVPVCLLDVLDTDELSSVLLHEDMHRRRFDPVIALMQRVASSLMFFFPLVPLVQRRLMEAAELRCDEAVRGGVPPAAYVRALARTIGANLEPAPAFAALGDGSRSLLARRIERLGEPWRTTTMLKHRIAIGAGAAILGAGVLLPIAPTAALADGATAGVKGDVSGGVKGGVERGVVRGVAGGVDGRVQGGVAGGVAGGVEGGVKGGVDEAAEETVLPKIITKVQPNYPRDAIEARAEGVVLLEATIKEDGSVGEVEILRHPEGWRSLGESAAKAVRQWRYQPAMKDGRPVQVKYDLKITFSLEKREEK